VVDFSIEDFQKLALT
jgi:hypothetical protein